MMAKKYDDIRDYLAATRFENLSGKGASEEEICICEGQLSLHFPPSYRIFLSEFGWGYFGSMELVAGLGVDIPKEWDRGANILHVVNDERQGPLRVPKEIIPFCQNGAGDWYALDFTHRESDEVPVVFISHEESVRGEFSASKCADSFADWVFARLAGSKLQINDP